MIDCAIIGDSIAVGLAQQHFNCTVEAKVGVPSAWIIGKACAANIVIISAGSNDPANPNLVNNLRKERSCIKGKVIWIVPYHPMAAAAVLRVVKEFGDSAVTFRAGKDNVHPSSYGVIAEEVRRLMK